MLSYLLPWKKRSKEKVSAHRYQSLFQHLLNLYAGLRKGGGIRTVPLGSVVYQEPSRPRRSLAVCVLVALSLVVDLEVVCTQRASENSSMRGPVFWAEPSWGMRLIYPLAGIRPTDSPHCRAC